MLTPNKKTLWLAFALVLIPILLWSQHTGPATPPTPVHHEEELAGMFLVLEWIERIVDIVGIAILLIGFLKGLWVFIKLEFERFSGQKDFQEVFALRSTLGSYIILSLDFLIISDIIHSVIKPEFYELINLGIIVVLRTSIGFFLGRELMELSHIVKEEEKIEELDKEETAH